MHKITAAASALMLGVVASTAVTAASAEATKHQAAAAGSRSQGQVQVVHFVDRVDGNSNTDIDLGVAGPSAGDQQVFSDGLFANGRRVGTSTGVSQVVAMTPTSLSAQVVSTATLPAGQLTTQMAFTEVLAQGPPKVLSSAITGGTRSYRNARGECRGEFIVNTDDVNMTCTIILRD